MFRKLDDFMQAYRQHCASTVKIFGAMDEAHMDQRVADGFRTLGQIAWHIATTIPEMMNRTGLGLAGLDPQAPVPTSAARITEAYQAASEELLAALRSQWSDDTLLETDDMYGETWPRGVTLAVLMSHEAHHRGQMTVLLRQAGAKVPGIMGPAKEEWAQFGHEAPPY